MPSRSPILLTFLLTLAPACDGPPSSGSTTPSHRTYPPSPGADDVDAFGSAKDPEISACMEQISGRRVIAESLAGETGDGDESREWRTCWCRKRGYGGLGRDGACAP